MYLWPFISKINNGITLMSFLFLNPIYLYRDSRQIEDTKDINMIVYYFYNVRMIQQDQCAKCGNHHTGSCSTEAIYFYWKPQPYEHTEEVYIIGDWTKWQRKEKMAINYFKNGHTYFSVLLALTQGKHQYKYLVDGQWRYDVNAPTVSNQFGSFNNTVQILPKKTYLQKHEGLKVRISSNYCLQDLKIRGSWDDWEGELQMTKTFNPLKGCYQTIVDLDLEVNRTYQFKFKHGSQQIIDEKYPTIINTYGTLNNYIIVYQKFISIETPRIKKSVSSMSLENFNKCTKGRVFKWKKVQCSMDLPYERVEGHTMCSVGEYIYIFGGKCRNEFYNSLLNIDSKFQKVTFEEIVPDGRAFHNMKAYGNKILVYGGHNNLVLEDYHAFNVSQRKWVTHIQKIGYTKLQKQSCVIYQSLMVFFGGYHCENMSECSSDVLSSDLRVLDLQKMQWVDSIKIESDHPKGRFAHTASLIQSNMYIFGGISDPIKGTNLNDIWRINLQDIESLAWTKVQPKGRPPTARHGHTMNVIKNLLIIFGGQDDQNNLSNDLIVYHSIDNVWIWPVVNGSKPRPRSNHASTKINDQIIIFGGRTQYNSKNQSFYILQAADLVKSTDFFSEQDQSQNDQ